MSRSDQDIAAEISRTLGETGLAAWQVTVTEGVVHITGTGSDRERGAAIAIAQSVKGVRHVTAQAPEA
jgi:osmotically-inducible protein OsmY